jgi:endo-1,4-beta-D-glucanase Y
MRKNFFIILISILYFTSIVQASDRIKTSGAFYSGKYKNVFTEMSGRDEKSVTEKVEKAFNQLFYGNDSTERVYFPVEPGMAYIEDIEYEDVRSEGMSYGMMIAVQLDKQEEFNRLWKWTKTYMQQESGYFAWQLKTNGEIIDSTSASDGEEWIVMSLFFASGRWGDGEGIFNYRKEARAILNAMLNKNRSAGKDLPEGTLTDMFDKKEKQVVFVPEVQAAHFTDPSYHVPHFYTLWGKWADKENSFWLEAADMSRAFLKRAAHPVTGLYPEFAHFDGTPVIPWGNESGDFRYDAWRVIMNITCDYNWFTRDEWAVNHSNKLLDFFYSKGMGKYGNLYKLSGEQIGDNHSTGLVAMNAVAALATTNPNSKEFLEELWNVPIPSGKYRYYDGLLYMLAMLQLSGSFRIYDPDEYVSTGIKPGFFPLVSENTSAPMYISSKDYPGVVRVFKQLQGDIEKVTGLKPELIKDKTPAGKNIVIAGTIGKSEIIDELIRSGKLNIGSIKDKWESYIITIVKVPFPGAENALVIAGSDKRGTIYGIYDLSEKIGVSPWYWWADVPVKKHNNLYVKPGTYTAGEPKVKYRGIFINDEAPALAGWAIEKFGGFNHKFYENVFELILRLKGNFLWPAMWGRAFYDDDPENPKLADEYGIVISTSHHEPMMRAHVEWERYGKGPWNYETNSETLREFWREGIERMGNNESIVTLAMRGDGDEAMSPDANISLLEKIVNDQRKILTEVTGKPAESIPQVWALYKEVQEYYDKGMRVPDDVTVLLCDDNWGNIRKLPLPGKEIKEGAGGYGIYYHYDYVGGPRNYKWLNTSQVERVWEQMNLAYEYNAREIWIVNVGDIKPMEFPIEFFLDYAWNPEKMNAAQLPGYYHRWAAKQFGQDVAEETADIIASYTKFNSRRKPELLSPGTYSLTNFREAETILADYKSLEEKARTIYEKLPAEQKDAYYQLVLHSVEACVNLNELYVAAGKNYLYAEQERAAANKMAARVKELFEKDASITDYYNNKLAGGKWSHMMDQTHIGYTSWQQPDNNIMPEVKEIDPSEDAEMGVSAEGSEAWYPEEKSGLALPEFDPFSNKTHYIEIFNRGNIPFDYSIEPGADWIKLSSAAGKVTDQTRIGLSIDWEKAPAGKYNQPVKINGPGNNIANVMVRVNNPELHIKQEISGFIESNNYISVEASHYTFNRQGENGKEKITWTEIPNIGRTCSGMTVLPVTAGSMGSDEAAPVLEYDMYLFNSGEVNVKLLLSPTLNFHSTEGLRYAVSFDGQEPVIVNIHKDENTPDWKYPAYWNQQVADNIKIAASKHNIEKPGKHTLKIRMVDPGIVIQKIVVETDKVGASYLGPPESAFVPAETKTGSLLKSDYGNINEK